VYFYGYAKGCRQAFFPGLFANVRKNGICAITLEKGDQLIGAGHVPKRPGDFGYQKRPGHTF